MKILVINAGSSSLKYQVIDTANEKMLGKGIVERIGGNSLLIQTTADGVKKEISAPLKNHTEAFKQVMSAITDKQFGFISDISEIGAIGHRVVHSAEDFSESVLVDGDVLRICEGNSKLAPLHQPANVACIKSCAEVMPGVPNVAVFDTAFHATIPQHAYMYAVDYDDYLKYKVRRYGFHGTSHKFVAEEAVKYLNKKNSKIITCHLGNGSSITAVSDGKSVDTSMGLTPLEGLIMGTRSGDIDPAVILYLAEQKNIEPKDVLSYLNKNCGFTGIAGVSDFRDLTGKALAGDKKAMLAIDMFQYRIKKYIGSFAAAMGGLDCVVLTGGIGENAPYARKKIFENMEYFGINFDFEKNETAERGVTVELTKPESRVKVLVIPTNEELVIARETLAAVKK